jgi:uncharacterized protein YdhG (YjbR/CyaY superfamily)
MTVEEYITRFPQEVQEKMRSIRSWILELVPSAEESFSYGMPAYKYNKKPLIYFAGYKNHIGLYATPNTHDAFAEKLKSYKQGKGSVQFSLGVVLPELLIKEMIQHRKETLKFVIQLEEQSE